MNHQYRKDKEGNTVIKDNQKVHIYNNKTVMTLNTLMTINVHR